MKPTLLILIVTAIRHFKIYDKPNIDRPADGIPQNIAEHMKLMIDILVLGFQTDTTRVATLKLNNDHSALPSFSVPRG